MNGRTNPFEDLTEDLSDFEPKPKSPLPASTRVEDEKIDGVAQAHGFTSRQPSQSVKPATSPRKSGRRYTTGRNQQINIKATSETIERLYRLADALNIPMGELLEQALKALESQEKTFLEK